MWKGSLGTNLVRSVFLNVRQQYTWVTPIITLDNSNVWVWSFKYSKDVVSIKHRIITTSKFVVT